MSDYSELGKIMLTLHWTDHASERLNARIAELRECDLYVELDSNIKAIQFLRGVASRASFVLPAFYTQLAATMVLHSAQVPFWQRVHATSAQFSSLLTISLACRAIFDDGRDGLTGKFFSRTSDAVLSSVAQCWATTSRRPITEATPALELLRELFKRCARPAKILFVAPSLLERRVGLLKYHADRLAAHITLAPYLFHTLDLIHVVAAIATIGAMIVDFDDPTRAGTYFDSVDEGAWAAAKQMFPDLPGERLFHNFKIHEQVQLYWKIKQIDGLDMLLNQLPAAIGYWDSASETAASV